jgi:hypothetical protein
MLVNHLRNRVTQQHYILIKRFDLTLQFDTVDQIDGNRYMLPTQCIQEGVLQELAFIIHDIFRVRKN